MDEAADRTLYHSITQRLWHSNISSMQQLWHHHILVTASLALQSNKSLSLHLLICPNKYIASDLHKNCIIKINYLWQNYDVIFSAFASTQNSCLWHRNPMTDRQLLSIFQQESYSVTDEFKRHNIWQNIHVKPHVHNGRINDRLADMLPSSHASSSYTCKVFFLYYICLSVSLSTRPEQPLLQPTSLSWSMTSK